MLRVKPSSLRVAAFKSSYGYASRRFMSSDTPVAAVIKSSTSVPEYHAPALDSTTLAGNDMPISTTWELFREAGFCSSFTPFGWLQNYMVALHEFAGVPWLGAACIMGATFPVVVGGFMRVYQREVDAQKRLNDHQELRNKYVRQKALDETSQLPLLEKQKLMDDFKASKLGESAIWDAVPLMLESVMVLATLRASSLFFHSGVQVADGGAAFMADPAYIIAIPMVYLLSTFKKRSDFKVAIAPESRFGNLGSVVLGATYAYFAVFSSSLGATAAMTSYAVAQALVQKTVKRPQMVPWKRYGGIPQVRDTWKWATLKPTATQ